MTSINNAWVQLANGKILPYYGPDYEYEDLVIKVSMEKRTPTIRSMTDDERNRAKERDMANMHDPFSNFPKKSLEDRVKAIEEFMEVLLNKSEYRHALEVKRMKANVKRSMHEHYKVKPNYTD